MGKNLQQNLSNILNELVHNELDYNEWKEAGYRPTPTIIEASKVLYEKHDVEDIARNDASAKNLTKTSDSINKIIEESKINKTKSIVFVTGVPGAGKTLVGLNVATQRKLKDVGEHVTFLSGNRSSCRCTP